MELNALMLSTDTELASLFHREASDLGITPHYCKSPELGLQLLESSHYDAIVVEYDPMKTSPAFLLRLRSSKANRNTPRIVVTSNSHRSTATRELAALLSMEKPVTSQRMQQNLRAALGAMQQERR